MWWLKQQQQVNMKAGVGTPEWAIQRLEPRVRV
jgi:4-hydroxy-3-methylbut-2-enyl diphosphate reductase IspH